jgi:hypothetical protein
MTDQHSQLDRFRRGLETYGADLARWPEAERSAARSLMAASAEARALHQEEAALDRLLAKAPAVSASRHDRVADAIMAAIASPAPAERATGTSGNVIALPARPRRLGAPRSAERLAKPLPRRQIWQAAAGLAASLAIGIMIGTFDLAPSSMTSALLGSASDLEVAQLVSAVGGDGLTPSFDEDQL